MLENASPLLHSRVPHFEKVSSDSLNAVSREGPLLPPPLTDPPYEAEFPGKSQSPQILPARLF